MKSRLFVFGFLLCLGLLPISCSKDSREPQVEKYPVSLSFNLPGANSGNRVQNNDLSLVVKAMVTITKEDGSATEFTEKVLEVYESEGVYYSEEIKLPAGRYLLTELLLLDVEGITLFAVPSAGNLQEYIDQQLPIPFEVTDSNTAKTVVLEVLSTFGFTPEEFGFDPEDVKFKALMSFLVALRDKYDPEKYLEGELHITADLHYEIAIDSAEKILLKEAYEPNGEIDMSIKVNGYLEYQYTFKKDSLLHYSEEPLIIKLKKIQEEEATYIGNVVLASQEEVDEFGSNRYEYLLGNLIIDDREGPRQKPIQELRQLQALRKVEGDFIVRDNPSLQIFWGMIIGEVTGDFVLEGNPEIEELSGLQDLRKIGGNLSIMNNSSLVDYCAISKLFYESPGVQLEIKGNAYNPTIEEIKDNKTCSAD